MARVLGTKLMLTTHSLIRSHHGQQRPPQGTASRNKAGDNDVSARQAEDITGTQDSLRRGRRRAPRRNALQGPVLRLCQVSLVGLRTRVEADSKAMIKLARMQIAQVRGKAAASAAVRPERGVKSDPGKAQRTATPSCGPATHTEHTLLVHSLRAEPSGGSRTRAVRNCR